MTIEVLHANLKIAVILVSLHEIAHTLEMHEAYNDNIYHGISGEDKKQMNCIMSKHVEDGAIDFYTEIHGYINMEGE